jgi:hypothetical protein
MVRREWEKAGKERRDETLGPVVNRNEKVFGSVDRGSEVVCVMFRSAPSSKSWRWRWWPNPPRDSESWFSESLVINTKLNRHH